MSQTIAAAVIGAVLLLTPSPSLAWGADAHRYIMAHAIDRLPPELRPFFDAHKAEVVVRIIDPDLWRVVGWEEDQNHFVNFGVPEFGPYPFTALPREYGAALEKFGHATLKRDGLLPWREAEEFGELRRAFESFARNAPRAPSDTVLFAAVASHYIQDAHQPLHAVDNYDGQLSGQRGVHARFETVLFERFQDKIVIRPPSRTPITNARDAAFDALLESYGLVDQLLKADKEASAGKDTYDDEYFERFFTRVRPILERRLAESIAATASLITGAWELAGKPTVRAQVARPIERVRPR
jgi:hypothetical protein